MNATLRLRCQQRAEGGASDAARGSTSAGRLARTLNNRPSRCLSAPQKRLRPTRSSTAVLCASIEGDTPALEASVLQRPSGYLPFEYVTFTDNHMTHEITVKVRR